MRGAMPLWPLRIGLEQSGTALPLAVRGSVAVRGGKGPSGQVAKRADSAVKERRACMGT